jgi:hypothetical protein
VHDENPLNVRLVQNQQPVEHSARAMRTNRSATHWLVAPETASAQPQSRRARNPEIRGDGHVAGLVDEIPQPVVVVLLRAS